MEKQKCKPGFRWCPIQKKCVPVEIEKLKGQKQGRGQGQGPMGQPKKSGQGRGQGPIGQPRPGRGRSH